VGGSMVEGVGDGVGGGVLGGWGGGGGGGGGGGRGSLDVYGGVQNMGANPCFINVCSENNGNGLYTV